MPSGCPLHGHILVVAVEYLLICPTTWSEGLGRRKKCSSYALVNNIDERVLYMQACQKG
jgi:hypothetical protein